MIPAYDPPSTCRSTAMTGWDIADVPASPSARTLACSAKPLEYARAKVRSPAVATASGSCLPSASSCRASPFTRRKTCPCSI